MKQKTKKQINKRGKKRRIIITQSSLTKQNGMKEDKRTYIISKRKRKKTEKNR